MNVELMDDARQLRAKVDALQIIPRRNLSLRQIRLLGANIGQLAANFLTQVLVYLPDLQLKLKHLAARLRDRRS